MFSRYTGVQLYQLIVLSCGPALPWSPGNPRTSNGKQNAWRPAPTQLSAPVMGAPATPLVKNIFNITCVSVYLHRKFFHIFLSLKPEFTSFY